MPRKRHGSGSVPKLPTRQLFETNAHGPNSCSSPSPFPNQMPIGFSPKNTALQKIQTDPLPEVVNRRTGDADDVSSRLNRSPCGATRGKETPAMLRSWVVTLHRARRSRAHPAMTHLHVSLTPCATRHRSRSDFGGSAGTRRCSPNAAVPVCNGKYKGGLMPSPADVVSLTARPAAPAKGPPAPAPEGKFIQSAAPASSRIRSQRAIATAGATALENLQGVVIVLTISLSSSDMRSAPTES
jgi:hypothetical protein